MDAPDWRRLVPGPVRRLLADLAAVLALVVLAVLAVSVPGVADSPVRIVLGLPFLLFLPGYAVVAALFPEAGDAPVSSAEKSAAAGKPGEAEQPDEAGRGIDGIERVALSFGLSIAVVPLIGIALNATPWGIRLVPIVASVGGFTVAATAVAAHRRQQLPVEERYSVPFRAWLRSAYRELFEPETRADAALNVVLAASVLLATASVGYAVAVHGDGESFTEFYLLTEREDGDLVAADYPTEYVRGESKPVVVGVVNREHERTTYTVVVELQRVERVSRGNGSTAIRVTGERELDRFRKTLAHNETWHHEYAVEPTMTGTNLRVVFLLYRGSPPDDPTVGNAYRELRLLVNVTAKTNASTGLHSGPVDGSGFSSAGAGDAESSRVGTGDAGFSGSVAGEDDGLARDGSTAGTGASRWVRATRRRAVAV